MKKSPTFSFLFEITYFVMSKQIGRFFQISLAFSEYLNFTYHLYSVFTMHESRQMLPKWPILYAGNTVMIALLHCVSTSYKSLDNITFRFRLLNVNLKQKTILDSSHTIQKYKNMNKHHIPKHCSVCIFVFLNGVQHILGRLSHF